MTTTKAFPTLAVAGVYTGRLLQEGGFNDIHEVFDHLFPGIMTLGIAAMSNTASAEVARQLPQLVGLGDVGDDWQAYAATALRVLGPTLDVGGPMHVSEAVVSGAFAAMAERTR